MVHFLSLPPELLSTVLNCLTLADLYACEAVCQKLRDVVKTVEIQYKMALQRDGYDDVPTSSVSIPAKIEKLNKARDAWHSMKPRFVQQVPIKHRPSGIYDLCGGVYLLGDETRHILYWLRLPEEEGDSAEWQSLLLEENIIDMGLNIDESDLIAVITIVPQEITNEIVMHLKQFSTGEPHPEAAQPRISVCKSNYGRPSIGIEIVGDHLILILLQHAQPRQLAPDDRVFVYEWRTGKLKMSIVAPRRSYSGPIFLTEDTFLLPNAKQGSLEVWDINSPSPSTPRCSLALPTLAPGRVYSYISCRGEPNPVGRTSQPGSKFRNRASQANAGEALMIFNVTVDPTAPPFGGGLGHTYSFFARRKDVINVAANLGKYTSGSSQSSVPPTQLPVGKSPNDIHFPMPGGLSSTSEPDCIVVPWDEWGPNNTRWFEVDRLPTRWITTTAGQRAVMSQEEEGGSIMFIFDFNENTVKEVDWEQRQRAKRQQESDDDMEDAEKEEGVKVDKGKAVDRSEHSSGAINIVEAGQSHPYSVTADKDPSPPPASISPIDGSSGAEGGISPIDIHHIEIDDGDNEWVDMDDIDYGDDMDSEDDGSHPHAIDTEAVEGEEGTDGDEVAGQDAQPFTMLDLQNIHPALFQLLVGGNAQLLNQHAPGAIGGPGGGGQPPFGAPFGELIGAPPMGGAGPAGMPGGWFEVEMDGGVAAEDLNDSDNELEVVCDSNGVPRNATAYRQATRIDKYGRSFESPVESALPFVQYVTRGHPKYDGVLMDEERILGIITNRWEVITRVDIMYFG